MINKHKKRLYIVIIVFLILSFISATYAWFTFSGFVGVSTSVDVKAWLIEFKDGEEIITNSLDITSKEIYPGMETIFKNIEIDNKGDTSAIITINAHSGRVLNIDTYSISDTVTSNDILDAFSHNYPFKVNIVSESNVIAPKTKSNFMISISWPVDSGNDILDTYWGQEAYKFKIEEQNKLNNDSSYQILNPLEINLSVIASQYVEEPIGFDKDYQLGDSFLYNVVDNISCDTLSSNCIRVSVIENENRIENETVTLLPDLKNEYVSSTYLEYQNNYTALTNGWNVTNRPLKASDILKPISKDIENTVFKSADTSDIIVGNILYETRALTELNETIALNGYYSFNNSKYNYLDTANCVWTDTEYDIDNAFALKREDVNNSYLNKEDKSNICKVVPVIVVNKNNIIN